MRQELKDGREPQHARCAWIVAVAAIAMAGLVPAWATAQVPGAPPGDTAIDDADEAEETDAFTTTTEVTKEMLSEQQLDEAQRRIEQAERDLEEAKRQMQLAGRKLAPEPAPVPGSGPGLVSADGRAKKLQVSLNEDGTLYLRFAAWLQVWTRAIQMNPGTTIDNPDPVTNPTENQEAWYGDIGLRRARFLMFGQIFPRVFLLMHIGVDNQTWRHSDFKQGLFFHDAWVEFEVVKEYLSIGAGLIYWNGISRLTNRSTVTGLSLDWNGGNYPYIEISDQFARQLGIYAKGKVGLFDYRVAVTRPKQAQTPLPTVCCTGGYNPIANSWGFKGYFMLQFLDKESNVLPYTVGTYLGAKRVLNLGTGGYVQPRGAVYAQADGTLKEIPMWFASADFFADIPTGDNGNAITAYAAYYRHQMGPDYVRYVGIMNPGDVGSGIPAPGSGRGNQYPIIGTGNHGYAEFGWLIPGSLGDLGIKFQPYAHTAISGFEGLQDPMFWVGTGVNMFLHRHNAKVTLEYRNRPIYDSNGNVQSRKGNSFILQMQLFI